LTPTPASTFRLSATGDGYPEPLVVTFHKSTGFVARIVARFDAMSICGRETSPRSTHGMPIQNMTSSRILMAESMAWDLANSFARSMKRSTHR
jgi:hypothetical protein